ncbi:MAG: enhanced intracellular survival protein Eis [Elainellaceae cyanobacterium]
MAHSDYRAATTAQDIEFIARAEQQGFICSAADAERYIERIGLENFRILNYDSRPVGGLVILPQGQWWLGQKIAMAGVASVSVVPEARRQGHARALLHSMLQELYDMEMSLSALYSAAHPLYRQMGYGASGTSGYWQVPTNRIGVAEIPLSIRPVSLEVSALRPIQQQYARHQPGHLDRHRSIWSQIVSPQAGQTHFAYSFGPEANPEGYIVFSLKSGERPTLQILDWALITAAAGRSLWGFLAQQGTQIEVVRWRGGAVDPMAMLLPDHTAKLQTLEYWMLRLVNVPRALEARGYSAGVSAELAFDVIDEALPANHGCWTLSVSGGRGKVTRGAVNQEGKAQISLSVSALASLYSGLLSPDQMRQMGLLAGSDAAIATAASLFVGPSPWLPDFF